MFCVEPYNKLQERCYVELCTGITEGSFVEPGEKFEIFSIPDYS